MAGALYWIAKGLQLFGLILVPYGLYVGVLGGEFRIETWLAAGGIVAFYSAYWLERAVGRKADQSDVPQG
ncbi:MAG: hypothetical protein IT462_01560 [Planctomycetes bacterium]|nr:hypothetical protein [Planctomycetota bacterium]